MKYMNKESIALKSPVWNTFKEYVNEFRGQYFKQNGLQAHRLEYFLKNLNSILSPYAEEFINAMNDEKLMTFDWKKRIVFSEKIEKLIFGKTTKEYKASKKREAENFKRGNFKKDNKRS